ncbi:MAG TPA: hypoxanthine phosphoribosyltransferase [Methanocorpusculum sp.]|nr:hypoxanthine phosphoribosyltransferase [Methanocorpusculum sp.]
MCAQFNVLLSEEQINTRIAELAAEIDRDYAGKEVVFLITLRGAVIFGCELAKRVKTPVYFEFIQTSSYVGTTSSGIIAMKIDVDKSAIEGKHVIIIEDIIDTGKTLKMVKGLIQGRNPASLKICSLLDKHECRKVELEGDYIGFEIGNDFIVGYGLDYDQKYRNLPYIGIYDESKA